MVHASRAGGFWVARRGGPTSGAVPATSAGVAVVQIQAWNPRKHQILKPEHIRTARGQLAQQGCKTESGTLVPAGAYTLSAS